MKNKAIEENETVKHRLPLRLKDFDYTTPGGYFVTLCTLTELRHFFSKMAKISQNSELS